MGEATGIEWTGATWNPWHGCLKISPGCKNCYMYREKKQYGQDPMLCVRSKTKFNDPLKWSEPGLVFTCSWSDWFIDTADPWRDEAWDIVRRTPHLTYQILTKRPERILAHLPSDWGEGYKNVWLGVSAENQHYADERIPLLLAVPAAIHWLSCEPLLGPVDLYDTPAGDIIYGPCGDANCEDETCHEGYPTLDWVVVGGESGPKARPMDIQWARDIRDQCADNDVRFFLKQLGGARDKRGSLEQFPEDLRIRQFPNYASEVVGHER